MASFRSLRVQRLRAASVASASGAYSFWRLNDRARRVGRNRHDRLMGLILLLPRRFRFVVRQMDDELASGTGFARHVSFTAVSAGEMFDDSQAEAGPSRIAR